MAMLFIAAGDAAGTCDVPYVLVLVSPALNMPSLCVRAELKIWSYASVADLPSGAYDGHCT